MFDYAVYKVIFLLRKMLSPHIMSCCDAQLSSFLGEVQKVEIIPLVKKIRGTLNLQVPHSLQHFVSRHSPLLAAFLVDLRLSA